MATESTQVDLGISEEDIKIAEARIRRIFVGSLGLSGVLVLLLVLYIKWLGAVPVAIMVSFPSLALWSLVVTAYAFYSLCQTANKTREVLRRKSFLDEVTGVFNYRYLDIRLKEEYERTRRYGGFTTLLYVDLDGFKRVNDRLGHQVGNVVLQEIASAISRRVRTCDMVGRVGGDEFLAILPETDRRQAAVLANRLRESVENYVLDLGERGRVDFVRLSIGVAAYPVNGDSMENVISAADNAVYEAKRQGGNRICVASEFVSTEIIDEMVIRNVRGEQQAE